MILHEVMNLLLCFMNDMFFIMDNIIKFLRSYVLNMVNITCIYFFIVKRKKLLKSDVEFLKYIVIFSWHYVLPSALRGDNI